MVAPSPPPMAGALDVLCAGAVQGLIEALQARFERDANATLRLRFGAVGALRVALAGGAPCDVMIATEAMLRELAAAGEVGAGSVRPVGAVRTGVALRSGEPVPRLDDAGDLRAALLAATLLHVPDLERSTAGAHIAGVLARLGIEDAVRPKLVTHANGAAAMQALASEGPAGALGCTQISEIRRTPGLIAGALPEPFALSTVYAAGIATRAIAPALAQRLVDLLSAPAQAARRAGLGFDPL